MPLVFGKSDGRAQTFTHPATVNSLPSFSKICQCSEECKYFVSFTIVLVLFDETPLLILKLFQFEVRRFGIATS